MSVATHLLRVDAEIDALPPPPPDSDIVVCFALSLRSETTSPNWDRDQEMLGLTLRSILAQSDRNFQVIVAGHERPESSELDHPQVCWITVDFAPPTDASGYMADRNAKRRAIGVQLRRQGFDGLFMAMDADDWVHRRVVELARRSDIKRASYFDEGFMANWGKQTVWPRVADGKGRPFYAGCGSSSVYRFFAREYPINGSRLASKATAFNYALERHGLIPEQLQAAGVPVQFFGLPMVTWVLGHGNNDTLIRSNKPLDVSHSTAEPIGAEFLEKFRIYQDAMRR